MDDVLIEQTPDEMRLRRLLAVAYSGSKLYTDDGELQDGSTLPVIDFKRDTVDEIEEAITERGRKQAKEYFRLRGMGEEHDSEWI